MNKLLLIIIALPFFGFGQTNKILTNADLEQIYSQAITDFIQDVTKNKRIDLDTFFLRKRIKEEEATDNFPDIQLPESIAKVHIRIIPTEIGDIQQKELSHRVCANMLGYVDSKKATFDFFVFSNGFTYKFGCHIEYNYIIQEKKFKLVKLRFQAPALGK